MKGLSHLLSYPQRALLFYKEQPSILQPVAQGFFITLGIQVLGFSISWVEVAVIVLSAFAAETALSYATRGVRPNSLRGALSAAFSLSVFFRTGNIYYFVLAAAVAVISKYIFRARGTHIFNPSNFAIVVLTFLLPAATTVQFIQWGSSTYLYLLIATICLFVAYKTRTLEIALSFLGAYAVVFFVSVAFLPDTFVSHHYGLLSPVLILFATFMITDPKTAPRGLRPRILYGISIALAYFLLELYGVRYSIFVALFFVLLLNTISAYAGDFWGTRWRSLRTTPNVAAFGVILSIFLYAYTVQVIAPHRGDITPPSVDFILFGIQSNELLSCTTEGKVLVAQVHTGLENPAVTQGAAWGDYDGDGYDDLFVSNWDKPSRLYHNDRNGSFTDVTEEAGLPLVSSPSAFFADYDDNGTLDLFITSPGSPGALLEKKYPYAPLISFAQTPAVQVYKNTGGKFSDTTKELGLDNTTWPKNAGSSMSFADYNNDGKLDFVISSRGFNMVVDFANQSFSRADIDPDFITAGEIICDPEKIHTLLSKEPKPSDPEMSRQVQAFLAEKDLCLRVSYAPELISGMSTTSTQTSSTHTYSFLVPGTVRLFAQENGRFLEKPAFATYLRNMWKHDAAGTRLFGTYRQTGMSGLYFQPLSFDYDGDGRSDIFITVDTGRNLLLKNMGRWVFEDRTALAGLDYTGTGMGTDIGDIQGDGRPDIFVTNTLDDFVFTNKGDGTFSANTKGISALGIGWGVSFLDYNLDGAEDLYIENGDISRTGALPLLKLSTAFFRADRLYKNENGILVDRTWKDFCSDFQSGRSLAVSDYDNDGDPDVFIGNITPPDGAPLNTMGLFNLQGGVNGNGNVLLENTTNTPAQTRSHYLEIKLRGTASNAMGIGALVHVRSAEKTQTRFAILGGSYDSQNSSRLSFGLGKEEAPVEVSVVWPSGHRTTLTGVRVDQMLTVSENQ